MKYILFITSSNLATNPRCVKEIMLARECGYNVKVIKFQFDNWSRKLDEQIIADLQSVEVYNLSGDKKPVISFFIATCISAVSRLLTRFFKKSLFLAAISIDKRTWLIYRCLKSLKVVPAWVVAHNPAAFWPALQYAYRKGAKFAVDIEDYHPGEYVDRHKQERMLFLLRKVLSKTTYVSFASPLISDTTLKQVTSAIRPVVINNCFSQNEFVSPSGIETKKIRIVWYSQHIDFGRGLEKILPMLLQYKDDIEITLIGNLRPHFAGFLSTYQDVANHVLPISQQQLHKSLSNYDVSLAIEDNTKDQNRSLCLTNKIWSYFQAGLFILATDTTAQSEFLALHPGHGIVCNLSDNSSMQNAIEILLSSRQVIAAKANSRYLTAQKFSWEVEKQKLQKCWAE